MASRPTGRMIEIADAVGAQIAAHARDYPHLWLFLPQTIEVGLRADQADKPRPIVVVGLPRVNDSQERGGTLNRSEFHLSVLVATENADDPQGAILEAVADVSRVVEADVTLGGTVLVDGFIFREGYEVEIDLESVGGRAVAEITFVGSYLWESDAP